MSEQKKAQDVIDQLNRFLRKQPSLGKQVFICKSATVVGDVTLGDFASVWHGAVLRADINRIVVGNYSNVQDNAVLHLSDELPCIIGDYVTVGHAAVIHGATVANESLIGMGAVILDGAEIGEQCIVGARSLVTPGTKIPAGSMVMGSPAKVVRPLRPEEREGLKYWAEKYACNAAYHIEHRICLGGPSESR
jgi:gamma-carbonic anhydrase